MKISVKLYNGQFYEARNIERIKIIDGCLKLFTIEPGVEISINISAPEIMIIEITEEEKK